MQGKGTPASDSSLPVSLGLTKASAVAKWKGFTSYVKMSLEIERLLTGIKETRHTKLGTS